MKYSQNLSKAIAKRLPLYRQGLARLKEQGKTTVSSKELSNEVGIEAAMIRKDLANFGELGKRGVGYNVDLLYRAIGRILNIDQHWEFILVGSGKMASALVEYNSLYGRNFRIVAVFSPEPVAKGTMVEQLMVQPITALGKFIKDREIKLAVLTGPIAKAQMSADVMVQNGVQAILNFTPLKIEVPENVHVVNDILTMEMQMLACLLDGAKQ
ncbi:redox-sensing transcriptional repressor Rex [Peptococcaceae bacterium 1198_IL3148]